MTGNFKPAAQLSALRQRATILQQIRHYFDQRGFFEVETPLLSHDVIVDRYIDPIAVSTEEVALAELPTDRLWLQTSPEFGMKRLLASGAEAIYQITRAFRAGESGRWHNPEFTMLEWYRRGDTMDEAIERLGSLAASVLNTAGFDRTSYRDVFLQLTGIDALENDSRPFADYAKRIGLETADLNTGSDVDQWRNLFLSEVIEPHLGTERPVVVFDYPATQAALARIRPGTPPVAERFELYFHGIELANGYHELLDAEELVHRNHVNNRIRHAEGRRQLPVESRLISAMRSGLPDCCGVALGVDRLVMVIGGYDSIEQTLAFPIRIA